MSRSEGYCHIALLFKTHLSSVLTLNVSLRQGCFYSVHCPHVYWWVSAQIQLKEENKSEVNWCLILRDIGSEEGGEKANNACQSLSSSSVSALPVLDKATDIRCTRPQTPSSAQGRFSKVSQLLPLLQASPAALNKAH